MTDSVAKVITVEEMTRLEAQLMEHNESLYIDMDKPDDNTNRAFRLCVCDDCKLVREHLVTTWYYRQWHQILQAQEILTRLGESSGQLSIFEIVTDEEETEE